MEARTDPNWKPPPTKVIELTDSKFKKYLDRKPLALVLFYAEYCQHCLKVRRKFDCKETKGRLIRNSCKLGEVKIESDSPISSSAFLYR